MICCFDPPAHGCTHRFLDKMSVIIAYDKQYFAKLKMTFVKVSFAGGLETEC